MITGEMESSAFIIFFEFSYVLQETLDENDDLVESPPTLAQFRAQIDHYEEIYVEIEKMESSVVLHDWFRLDVRPFRQALLNVVKRWSFMFKEHLMNYVVNSLSELEEFIKAREGFYVCIFL